MAYCPKCGKDIGDVGFCPDCDKKNGNSKKIEKNKKYQKISLVIGIPSIILIIILIVWAASMSANEYGTVENTNYQVNINYPGTWEGTILSDGNTESVSGTGAKTVDVDSSRVISVEIQKQDANNDELLVTITQDGQMEDNASTTAPYGLAGMALNTTY